MGISKLRNQEVGQKLRLGPTELELADGPIKEGDYYLVERGNEVLLLCCLWVKKGFVWSKCGRYSFHIVNCWKVNVL